MVRNGEKTDSIEAVVLSWGTVATSNKPAHINIALYSTIKLFCVARKKPSCKNSCLALSLQENDGKGSPG